LKKNKVVDLRINDDIQELFMVKSFAVKTGTNKKQYLDVVLSDNSGDIPGKKWDVDEKNDTFDDIKEGVVVLVTGRVTEWNGGKQLRIAKIGAAPAGMAEMADYIKAAPESPDSMLFYINRCVAAMKDDELRAICARILSDNETKLRYYPAAAKNHHAEMSGLLYHIRRMLEMAGKVCEVYDNLNRDLVMTGVIIHDIEKLNEMEASEQGVVSSYTFEGQMLGHLIQGVKIIDRLAESMKISHEKAIMLEHMMISHHYEAEYGSPKKPLFPEAEILHYLDMIDAKMYDMEEALASTEPGMFSDKVWTMDSRRLYKSKELLPDRRKDKE
jgi:3'-5' exoribonuclease